MTLLHEITAQLSRGALGLFGKLASPRLSILIFHRVHRQTDSLLYSDPDAAEFARLARFLARAYRVLTLGEAARHLSCGSLPTRALVITFDDGYADNAEVALPILQRYGLRATFFVSSGFLDGGRMWNDTVIESVRRSPHSTVDLSDFGLEECLIDTVADRRQVIGKLLPRLKYLAPCERDDAVARVQRLCGVAELPDDLMLKSEQVRELHAAGMEIGGHTVSHPILTSLSLSAAEDEVARGRDQLQAIIDAPVDVFAFPNGKPGTDYGRSHVDLLKRQGFRAAVTTAPGVSRTGDDPYQLPRFTPWGRSLPVWAARLALSQRNTAYAVASDAPAPDA